MTLPKREGLKSNLPKRILILRGLWLLRMLWRSLMIYRINFRC